MHFFSCEYEYVELKLYTRIVWFKEQSIKEHLKDKL